MKTTLYFVFILLFTVSSYGQLALPPKFSEGKSIKRIIEHYYNIRNSDSLKITKDHAEKLTRYSVKSFDEDGNLKKMEYFDDGILTSSTEYLYEKGRMVHEVYDTTLNTGLIVGADYSYPEQEDYVYIKYYQKDKRNAYFRFKEDERGNKVWDGMLDSNKTVLSYYEMIYSTRDKPLRSSNYIGNSRHSEIVYIYDEEENIKKILTISPEGKIIKTINYKKVDKHEFIIVEIDELTKQKKESRYIYYNNEDSNLHKYYLLSYFSPQTWEVKEFKYEFY